ncbi:FAD-binding protein [Streptomyces curacoi]|uniref:FAD-binding protein n=1 Tax=Streptomyces curacoi TaxID=146536 RepID=UPI00131A83F8|nr:FAD-binding protein [Streptomyces curacoi]
MTVVRPLRIAVLVKQVPNFESLRLGGDRRLERTGHQLEMNPYCRRAVAQGVHLARESGGECVVLTLGPPAAEDCLREAVACGAVHGVLISDEAFAGSDTLATARALAAALVRLGPFDLVLCGRNSVDAETGQTPAQIAELLDLPMAAGVRELTLKDTMLVVRCEHDDGWLRTELPLPALLTCAERLIHPAKAAPAERADVRAGRISRLNATELGPGPWGDAASMTVVGASRRLDSTRLRLRFDGDVDAQVERAVVKLAELGAFDTDPEPPLLPVPQPSGDPSAGDIVVLAEPGRDRLTRELLGRAALLAAATGRIVTSLGPAPLSPTLAGSWGADVVATISGSDAEQDIAEGLAAWCSARHPWAVLAPSTMWGREIAGRVAARLGAGLVGDAVDVVTNPQGELVCWKPAFSGGLVAAVTCRSTTRFATVRGGTLRLLAPRAAVARRAPDLLVVRRGAARGAVREFDDDLEALEVAPAVVCLGAAVPPEDYPLLDPLRHALGAELAATRKVTDQGWQPRARQIGVTGRSVAPRLYVAIGTSGKFANMAGARGAGLVLGINSDSTAPLFEAVDVGVVADWRDAVPRLVTAMEQHGLRHGSPLLARGSTR